MIAVPDLMRRMLGKAHICLVNQCRGINCQVRIFLTQAIVRQAAQLGIDQRNQRLECLFVASFPSPQKTGNLAPGGHVFLPTACPGRTGKTYPTAADRSMGSLS